MPETVYAVQTRTCTYLLDEEGICQRALSATAVQTTDAARCVGAQFVACLDLAAAGGLVGELRIGAAVLFARSENGRLVLLRTGPIEKVEHRDAGDAEPGVDATMRLPLQDPAVQQALARASMPRPPGPPVIAAPSRPAPPRPEPRLPPVAIREAPPPAHRGPSPSELELEAIDDMDIEETVSPTEITLRIPLYRPDLAIGKAAGAKLGDALPARGRR
jgi:hypothetical protein